MTSVFLGQFIMLLAFLLLFCADMQSSNLWQVTFNNLHLSAFANLEGCCTSLANKLSGLSH